MAVKFVLSNAYQGKNPGDEIEVSPAQAEILARYGIGAPEGHELKLVRGKDPVLVKLESVPEPAPEPEPEKVEEVPQTNVVKKVRRTSEEK